MANQYSEWIDRAKIDLESAEILLTSNRAVHAVSVYESHQAIEKMLKAYLIFNDIQIKKTHGLMKLLSLAVESNPSLKTLASGVQRLDELYPVLRYPTGDHVELSDAKDCFEIASKVIDFLSQLMVTV